MGMFDSVFIDCPVCQHTNEFQTKSGPCFLDCYRAGEWMPSDLLSGMDAEACEKCSHVYHGAPMDIKFEGNDVQVMLHAVSGPKDKTAIISPMGNLETYETLHRENKRLLEENNSLRQAMDQMKDLYRLKDLGYYHQFPKLP